jgi:tetratricopeptide (TPR) repeat protein
MPTKRRSRPTSHAPKKASSSAHAKRGAAAKPAKPSKPSKPARPLKPARPATRSKPVAKEKAPAKPLRRVPAKPPAGKPARRLTGKPASGRAGLRAAPGPAVAPDGASSRDQAVEKFERGFQALQQRQFGKAAELLRAVLNNYADEKELQERARVYLAICERQAAHEAKPRSFEDRLHAATVIVNRGAFDEALAQLRKLESDGPANDYVQYLQSVVYTAVGNAEQALAHLRKAIDLAPENLIRAAQDPDLEPLRQDAGFAALAGELPRRRRQAGRKQ